MSTETQVVPEALQEVNWPSVTAVVPTVNRPRELMRAVEAILEQDYPGHVECIVVFDRTEPLPPPVAVGPNRSLRVVQNARTPGLAGTRNTGFLLAHGELLASCDDDDAWLPGKLLRQVELLRSRPDASAVATGILIDSNGSEIARRTIPSELKFDDLLVDRHMEVHPSSFVVTRAKLIDSIGLVDENLPGGYAEDYEWLLRAARTGPVVCVQQSLVRVYWNDTSYFVSRWETIERALTYLLERVPEFTSQPAGLARIEGQLAFAHAAMGHRREAVRLALRSLRRSTRVRQSYAALAVAAGLVSADRVVAAARRYGRGI